MIPQDPHKDNQSHPKDDPRTPKNPKDLQGSLHDHRSFLVTCQDPFMDPSRTPKDLPWEPPLWTSKTTQGHSKTSTTTTNHPPNKPLDIQNTLGFCCQLFHKPPYDPQKDHPRTPGKVFKTLQIPTDVPLGTVPTWVGARKKQTSQTRIKI